MQWMRKATLNFKVVDWINDVWECVNSERQDGGDEYDPIGSSKISASSECVT